MRLIKLNGEYNNEAYEFEEFYGDNVPSYFILSHTWGKPSDELSYRKLLEYQTSSLTETPERTHLLRKVRFCAKIAAIYKRVHDVVVEHCWIDTCCINKEDSNELSEAINSMFRWYQKSRLCLVYLSDVSVEGLDESQQHQAIKKSRWFTRGWTLQELIAPSWLEFYDVAGKFLKFRDTLAREINEITGIPLELLGRVGVELDLNSYTVEERLSWGESRQTTRIEDKAYCMQGLFNVHMPIIYGEREKAFARLKEEIEKQRKREGSKSGAWSRVKSLLKS